MTETKIRQEIIQAYKKLDQMGLNRASSGNISVRFGTTMLITPSGISADDMSLVSIAQIDLSQRDGSWTGPCKPSTEWRFHQDLLRARPDINAVVHTHAPFSTILAIARKPIPAIHYMIAAFGGSDIRVADYQRYGTPELSKAVVKAMEHRNGCLMANHGMLTAGTSLEKTMWLAGELEALAHQYYHAKALGNISILTDAQIVETAKGFETYGLQSEEDKA